jgi:IgGFc binding protein
LGLTAVVALSGCGHSHSAFDGADDAGGAPPSGTTADGGPGGNIVGDASSTPATNGCSGDLHDVIGPDGTVVETCPPDQGCANGACVPACQAAAASKGSVGCDFLVSTPGFAFGILPPCFAAFLANNWGTNAQVTLSRAGASLDPTAFGRVPDGTPAASGWPAVSPSGVPANDVAVFFLSSDPSSANPQMDGGTPLGCPAPDAVNAGTAVVDTTYGPTQALYSSGRGQSFHIVTSVPVSLYDMLPFGGAKSWLPSAQLVLPTTAWGENFIAVSPKECTGGKCVSTGGLEWLQVLGTTDGTTVEIRPVQTLPASRSGDVVAAPAGQASTYAVNAGEFIQWGYNADLSGTIFSSDNPIGVVSGAFLCLDGTTSPQGGGCDSAHQTMLPVGALGFEYVVQPYATRRSSLQPESIPYRLMGARR